MYNPLPVEILANALQDPIHKNIGRSRPARTKRTQMAEKFIPSSNQPALMGYREQGQYYSIQPETAEAAQAEWEDSPPDDKYVNILAAVEDDAGED